MTLVYFPIAHMVWYWAGPDAIDAAAKALAAATTPEAKKAAQTALDAVIADGGQVFLWGAIDFAGGTVVHINSGIAGLVGALVRRQAHGHGRELMPPHSMVHDHDRRLAAVGRLVRLQRRLDLEAPAARRLAMMATHFVATAAAALSWMFVEWICKGKPTRARHLSGAVAGLVAVTPASGFVGPMGAIVLGLVVGVVCLFFVTRLKHMLGYDDALDVFGVHCIGGIVGAIGTGILVAPMLGGTGIMDYTTGKIADYDFVTQVIAQCKAVATTLVWSGVVSLIILKVVDFIGGPASDGREGARRPRHLRPRRARLQHVSATRDTVRAEPGTAPSVGGLRSQDLGLSLFSRS